MKKSVWLLCRNIGCWIRLLTEEIMARSEKGEVMLPLYSWLEDQLEKREQNRAIKASVRARAQRRKEAI